MQQELSDTDNAQPTDPLIMLIDDQIASWSLAFADHHFIRAGIEPGSERATDAQFAVNLLLAANAIFPQSTNLISSMVAWRVVNTDMSAVQSLLDATSIIKHDDGSEIYELVLSVHQKAVEDALSYKAGELRVLSPEDSLSLRGFQKMPAESVRKYLQSHAANAILKLLSLAKGEDEHIINLNSDPIFYQQFIAEIDTPGSDVRRNAISTAWKRFVADHKSMASEHTFRSLNEIDIQQRRYVIGLALANAVGIDVNNYA